jgi:hypothetical protein
MTTSGVRNNPSSEVELFERYSFVAVSTTNLAAVRRFWVQQLGCIVTEERGEEFFIVDVGGLRLCVDLADGKTHLAGSTDPTIGLKVASVKEALLALAQRGLAQQSEVVHTSRSSYAIVHDPDGRAVVLTEAD